MEKRSLTNEQFPYGSSNGNYAIREGQLQHVADAIVMFNDAWSAVSRVTVLKCCVKSQFLGMQHTQCLNSLIENFAAADDVDIDLTVPDSRMSNQSYIVVDHQISQPLHNALTRHEFLEMSHVLRWMRYWKKYVA